MKTISDDDDDVDAVHAVLYSVVGRLRLQPQRPPDNKIQDSSRDNKDNKKERGDNKNNGWIIKKRGIVFDVAVPRAV